MDSERVVEEVELVKHGAQRPLSHSQSLATINDHIQQVCFLFAINAICPYRDIGITAGSQTNA